MAVVISEIVTEVVLAPPGGAPGSAGSPGTAAAGTDGADDPMDVVVRRATERVLEVLRREWDR
ncbi:hypothetical protein ASE38_01210 [Cellulomonas sp. Root930]|nr:hypothetical protein ASE38_01210 [Cellulomonas sp. Root930]